MKRRTKIVIGVAALVVIAVVIAAVLGSGRNKGIRVRTTKVDRKDLVQLVTANGTIQAKTKVELSANIMGQITKLNVEEGDHVKQGDLLLVIDQARYAAAVNGAKSNLQALEAELVRAREAAAQAKRDMERAEQQFADGILPEADRERARSTYDQAVASARRAERQVEQARADVASAQDSLEKTEIRAPMDGIVTARNIEQGEVVVTGTMNNPGTVLMTISDMSAVEAVLEVDQTDVPQLRIGQKASIRIDAFRMRRPRRSVRDWLEPDPRHLGARRRRHRNRLRGQGRAPQTPGADPAGPHRHRRHHHRDARQGPHGSGWRPGAAPTRGQTDGCKEGCSDASADASPGGLGRFPAQGHRGRVRSGGEEGGVPSGHHRDQG
jgi:RND family efflux transporter MFP subunit